MPVPARSPGPGRVYFVGAGPGDPGLLTLKGADCLRIADVVLHDELLDHSLLELAPAGCRVLPVGKRAGRLSTRQDEINRLLIEHARLGRRVVRLKGGDPFVFGRGGEEALALVAADIPFEIVPGVTAGVGAAAYAGIPLTHRGLAAAAVLATGHRDPDGGTPAIDWSLLADLNATLALYMASRRIPQLCAELIAGGRPPQTPAAAIESGTWPAQRRALGTLETLPDLSSRLAIRPPALVVVGEVVSLASQLDWFRPGPLAGRSILLTRAGDPDDRLHRLFTDAGAQVYSLPLLRFAEPADWNAVDQALDELAAYAWVVFSSPRAVEFFFGRLQQQGLDARALASNKVAAIGPGTAAALADRGISPDQVPDDYSQQGLLKALADADLQGRRVLLPAADIGRPELARGLEALGARPLRLTVYRNLEPEEIAWPAGLEQPDLTVFASPSAVERFCRRYSPDRLLRVACIGPTTADAARRLGLTVDIQPPQSNAEALVQTVCDTLGPAA